ncbi:mitochondrial carrier domain-containing protein [Polychytrium aggregatum]|uniref:mitochondrial carrier domain-containing protein n=1 Tax=Polychytrium aggregatum TaxID=110093 RepID=UPI0022FE2950|nr:mitochondrial carrier domain-containing protein [Polychytrium aggregatum]KAI9203681.1 mitochondrial carrier domain-containing protein [Polychytrium aggregatum]
MTEANTAKPKSGTLTGSRSVDQALAGFSAGFVSTAVLHPFDLIKTRFQVSNQQRHTTPGTASSAGSQSSGTPYQNTLQAYRYILKDEGGHRALYRGVVANLAGSTLSWGFYFFWYDTIKSAMRTEKNQKLSPGHHMLASMAAGGITVFFTNPFWLAKTRICAQKASDPGAYKGLWDCLSRTYRQEGIRGLYRGVVPALIGTSHGAVQFTVYEELKKVRAELVHGDSSDKLGTLEYLAMAALSKIMATSITYPYQVVKARIQNQRSENPATSRSVLGTVGVIWRNEGLRGFYRGLETGLLRVLPGTCITFVVYETLSKAFANTK